MSGGRATLLGVGVPTLPGSVADGAGTARVRPESLTVSSDPAGSAAVASVAFLGAVSRVAITLADGVALTAQMPSSAARLLSTGDRVTVGVQPDGVLVVRD